ncbi:MAG: hypothetical protein ABH919_00050 [bacterium]
MSGKYYENNRAKLEEELKGRQSRSSEIREAIDAWAEKKYGITKFSWLVDERLGKPKGVTTILARQIPTVKLEDVMCSVASRYMEFNPVAFSLTNDRYCCRNFTKYTYIRIPWLLQNQKKVLIEHELVVPSSLVNSLEGRILASIATNNGDFLPDFHQKMRDKTFVGSVSYPVKDLSSFLEELVKISIRSGKYDSSVFINDEGIEKKVNVKRININKLDEIDVRPPAGWYYPLYLSLFLDGRRILLESFDDVPDFQPFQQSMDEEIGKLGLNPLILKTPSTVSLNGFSSNLLEEYPKNFLDNPELLEAVLSEVRENALPAEKESPAILFQRTLKKMMDKI